ncbi:2-phosphosulfolactate phosphatase [Leifsonia aquatica]|uniref:2-phosphosulfolactate phosphatase n=1 Tax=Leifsonia aquatica TaxID=144185 RepID=UPI00380647EE
MTEPTTLPTTTASDTPDAPAAHRQAKYQVRFDWAADGARAVAGDADIVIWVDTLGDGAIAAPALDLAAIPGRGTVVAAGLTNPAAVASWVLAEQVRLGRRAMIAVVAAGGSTASGSTRFAVEDLLAAGAVIDALAALGIDYSSPEAAAACAAFTGLRGAVAHLLTASASGQELVAAGVAPAEIAPAGRLGTVDAVEVLRAPAD